MGTTRTRILKRVGRVALSWLLVNAALGGAVALYALFVEPRRIVVEHASAHLPARSDRSHEGVFRLGFVSDFDLTAPPGRLERRVRDTINGLQSDMIAIGGDLFGGDVNTPPTPGELDALREYLAGFRAKEGVVVVWGERDRLWPDLIRSHLPPGVRDIQAGAEIHRAGGARLRFCGPEGLFPPLWIDPAGGGRLLAGWGPSQVVARYRGPEAGRWTGVDVVARMSFGALGDAPGIAVLEEPGRTGLRLRVAPDSLRWEVMARKDAAWAGVWQDRSVFVTPGKDYFVQVQAAPSEAGTRLRSRIWAVDQPRPSGWPIDMVDDRPDRPRQGTVAVLAGGSWRGSYRTAFESLEVHDLQGKPLLKEEFDDPEAFAARWENPGGRPTDFDGTVLIVHDPRFLLDMPPEWGGLISVVLAGHTHGGQVRLPLFGPLHLNSELPRSWSAGWAIVQRFTMSLYVTRGVASTHVPIRLGCPPEVTDMRLTVGVPPPR